MSDYSTSFYNAYKPLRNFLRPHSLWSGLASIYFYMRFLEDEIPLPECLLTSKLRMGAEPSKAGLHPFLLDILSRELILNCQLRGGKTLANAHPMFKSMDMIFHLKDRVWGEYSGHQDDIMLEMSRTAHQQFPWQQHFSQSDITRYFRLYNHPKMAPILETEFGFSVVEFFQVLFILIGEFNSAPVLRGAYLNMLLNKAGKPLADLLNRICRNADELRAEAASHQSYDVNWGYTFNPLKQFPLVHAGDQNSAICPIPRFLAQRLTDGIYFDLIKHKSFANAIGASFETYVGDIFKGSAKGKLNLLKERKYGKPQRASVDWILEDQDGTIFIECKLARLDLRSKTEISEHVPLDSALRRLAKNVVQIYATLVDAIAGNYPHWQHHGQPIFPMIVTFYNWMSFGFFFFDELHRHVLDEFRTRNMDERLLASHPYTICAIEELEYAAHALQRDGILQFMNGKLSDEHRDVMLKSYLLSKYQDVVKSAPPPFDDDMELIANTKTRLII